jgi:hypothetical protein
MSQEEVEEVLIIEWEKNPKGKKTKPQSIYDSRIYRKRTRRSCLLACFFFLLFFHRLYIISEDHTTRKKENGDRVLCAKEHGRYACVIYTRPRVPITSTLAYKKTALCTTSHLSPMYYYIPPTLFNSNEMTDLRSRASGARGNGNH